MIKSADLNIEFKLSYIMFWELVLLKFESCSQGLILKTFLKKKNISPVFLTSQLTVQMKYEIFQSIFFNCQYPNRFKCWYGKFIIRTIFSVIEKVDIYNPISEFRNSSISMHQNSIQNILYCDCFSQDLNLKRYKQFRI